MIFWIDVRHALSRRAGLLIAATVLLEVLARLTSGVVIWSDAVSGIGSAGVLAAPVAGGIAAFESQLRYRQSFKTRVLGASRAPSAAILSHLGAVLFWAMLYFSAAAVAILVGFAIAGAHGRLELWWPVSGLTGVLAASALGYGLGVALRSWIAAPLTALALYFGGVVMTGVQGVGVYWISQLYPSSFRESSPFDVVITPTFIGQSLWYIGLVVAVSVIVVATARAGRLVPLLGAVLALALLFTGGAIVKSTNGQAVHSSPKDAGRYVCQTTSGFKICVLEAFKDGLPALEKKFVPLYETLKPTPLAIPPEIIQLPRGIGDNPPANAASLHMDSLGKNSLGQDYASFALEEFVQTNVVCRNNLDRVDSPDGGIWMIPVVALLANRGRVDSSLVFGQTQALTDAAHRLASLSPGDQRAWISAHSRDISDCKLKQSDYASLSEPK